MSHQIDFRCHGTAVAWNGHWAHSDFAWKLLRGRQVYFINRVACAAHLQILERAGARVVRVGRMHDTGGIPGNRLAPRFRHLSQEDLTTRSAFVQAVKPAATTS